MDLREFLISIYIYNIYYIYIVALSLSLKYFLSCGMSGSKSQVTMARSSAFLTRSGVSHVWKRVADAFGWVSVESFFCFLFPHLFLFYFPYCLLMYAHVPRHKKDVLSFSHWYFFKEGQLLKTSCCDTKCQLAAALEACHLGSRPGTFL